MQANQCNRSRVLRQKKPWISDLNMTESSSAAFVPRPLHFPLFSPRTACLGLVIHSSSFLNYVSQLPSKTAPKLGPQAQFCVASAQTKADNVLKNFSLLLMTISLPQSPSRFCHCTKSKQHSVQFQSYWPCLLSSTEKAWIAVACWSSPIQNFFLSHIPGYPP